MKADMVSKPIRILVLIFVLGLVAWAAFDPLRDSIVSRRLARVEAQVAAADAEVASAGIQTAVFALG